MATFTKTMLESVYFFSKSISPQIKSQKCPPQRSENKCEHCQYSKDLVEQLIYVTLTMLADWY